MIKQCKYCGTTENLHVRKDGITIQVCNNCIKNHYKLMTEKNRKTCLEKHGDTNYRNTQQHNKTCLDRYGSENYTQTDNFKNKSKNSCLRDYGVECYVKSKEYKDRLELIKQKELESKSKTGYLTLFDGKSINQLAKIFNVDRETLNNNMLKYDKSKLTIEDIKNISANIKSSKTCIETIIERELNILKFNKYPTSNLKYRPDFKLSDNLYLNVDGLYWHSELENKDTNYHFNMRKGFEDNKLRILQIREDEINFKFHIVKSIINNLLNKNNIRIGARSCILKQVSQKEASIFLIQNHMMGDMKAKHIGLYYKDELISIMSFKLISNNLKIERYCNKINTSISGGFSKLLSYLERSTEFNRILYWVDLRYGTGDFLYNLGFIKEKETLGWKWTDLINTFNRLKCKANMDSRNLSEKEHSQELNWFKIYDAGQRLFIKTKGKRAF